MKTIAFALVLLTSFLNVQSQCSVDAEKTPVGTTLTAAKEVISKNVDLENGLKTAAIRIRIEVSKNPQSSYAKTYWVDAYTAASGEQKDIVPRELIISFKSSPMIRVKAARAIDYIPVQGVRQQACCFELTDAEYNQLSDPTEWIALRDSRTGALFDVKPYQKLLAEQKECLERLATK